MHERASLRIFTYAIAVPALGRSVCVTIDLTSDYGLSSRAHATAELQQGKGRELRSGCPFWHSQPGVLRGLPHCEHPTATLYESWVVRPVVQLLVA